MQTDFPEQVRQWYLQNRRDLPWRRTKDPYRIWLSEVILQQTQVAQGTAYYERFVKAFPDVKSLAEAHEDAVLKLWQGLGYYSRARNLHESANHVVEIHGGRFPDKYEDIRALKGVGDYTAAAIASIAFALPHACVDGNVQRVLARHFGVDDDVATSSGKKTFQALAQNILDLRDPGTHNQAMMEFGALQCKPVKPDCGTCVLAHTCVARRRNMVQVLPVKTKKVKVRERHFNYLVLADEGNRILLTKRNAGDIWQGLFEFALYEQRSTIKPEILLAKPELMEVCGKGSKVLHVSKPYVHTLTHQKLHARFIVVKSRKRLSPGSSVPLNKLRDYPFPKLIDRFLSDIDLEEML